MAVLWFGNCKPQMLSFLKPIHDEFKMLDNKGEDFLNATSGTKENVMDDAEKAVDEECVSNGIKGPSWLV